jgi:hypothetical protein
MCTTLLYTAVYTALYTALSQCCIHCIAHSVVAMLHTLCCTQRCRNVAYIVLNTALLQCCVHCVEHSVVAMLRTLHRTTPHASRHTTLCSHCVHHVERSFIQCANVIFRKFSSMGLDLINTSIVQWLMPVGYSIICLEMAQRLLTKRPIFLSCAAAHVPPRFDGPCVACIACIDGVEHEKPLYVECHGTLVRC